MVGTNGGTVNTANVTFLLSEDDGANFNTVLAASVPNNGSANVTLPNENIANARIMVKALNNIYFVVNSTNFPVNQKTLSTSETTVKNHSIYPNPASDFITVSLKRLSQKADY